MEEKNYSLFVDSNIFNVQNELNDFLVHFLFGKIEELIQKLEINDIIENIEICLPKIVLMEITKQQDERYDLEFQKFIGKTYPNFKPTKKEKYFEFLLKDFNKKLKINDNFYGKVKIFDYPSTRNFNKIINRAILKLDPFEGENGKGESDKGFKDVLLWHSLLEYKSKNLDKKIILFSNDSKLTSETCQEEFEDLFKEYLIIAKQAKEPYFEEVLKSLFSLQKIEKTEIEKAKHKLEELMNENFYPTFLMDKTIYSVMGEELQITDILTINIFVWMPVEEGVLDYIFIVNIQIYVEATNINNEKDFGPQEIDYSLTVKYNRKSKKFKILQALPLHKDISQEEYLNMLKFIEE